MSEILQLLKQSGGLAKGLCEYLSSGKAPDHVYYNLQNLYLQTKGRSNEYLHYLVTLFRHRYQFTEPTGILGDLTQSHLKTVTTALNQDGYYVFPDKVSDTICDRLIQFAKTAEGRPTPDQNSGLVRFDPNTSGVSTVHIPEETIVGDPTVQSLLGDQSILAVAQEYLGVAPILNILALWWSRGKQLSANSEAAQLFHFDLDGIRWIKFFIYLTDVNERSGPHCYVRGSHRSKGKNQFLVRKGQVRLSDEEIRERYPSEDIIELCGGRGTVIAEDTSGFHKGKFPTEGNRLLFQVEFSDTRFGSQCSTLSLSSPSESFRQTTKTFPTIYQRLSLR